MNITKKNWGAQKLFNALLMHEIYYDSNIEPAIVVYNSTSSLKNAPNRIDIERFQSQELQSVINLFEQSDNFDTSKCLSKINYSKSNNISK